MAKASIPYYFIGMFNPVHQGHLSLAAKIQKSPSRPVVFMPLPRFFNPSNEVTDSQRTDLLKIALRKASPSFSLDSSLLEADEGSLASKILERTLGGKTFVMREERWGHQCEMDISFIRSKEFDQIVQAHVEDEDVRGLKTFLEDDDERLYIEKNRLYYISRIAFLLKSEHRLEHSISVAKLAYSIALSNRLENPGKAYIAGLLHDLGKHCEESKEEEIMRLSYPGYLNFPKWSYHQFVGSYLAKREFGIDDPEILSSIEFHATGFYPMSDLGKIVYAADKIDPLRGYDSSSMITACKKNLEKGFLEVLRENRKYLTSKGYKVDNPATQNCFHQYLGD